MSLRLDLDPERSNYARIHFESYAAVDPTGFRRVYHSCRCTFPAALPLPLLYPLLYLLV
jgi:hypothetical protein